MRAFGLTLLFVYFVLTTFYAPSVKAQTATPPLPGHIFPIDRNERQPIH